MISSQFEVAGVALETPLVNAAGSINGINEEQIYREVQELAESAIGAITIGSFTVPPQIGNEAKYGAPVYFHDSELGLTFNSMGLPNIGLEAARTLMPRIVELAHDKNKPVIASVSPTIASKENGTTYNQAMQLIYYMKLAGVDLVELNVSCPNLVTDSGQRQPMLGYDLEGMSELLEFVAPYTGTLDSKVGVKLPPYTTDEQILLVPKLAEMFRVSKLFGFITTSMTVPNQVPRNKRGDRILTVPGGSGGMSGPSTKYRGREQLQMWQDALKGDVDIISTLGVDSGREVAIRHMLGAEAAGGVTFLWEGQKLWGQTITDTVHDFVESIEDPKLLAGVL